MRNSEVERWTVSIGDSATSAIYQPAADAGKAVLVLGHGAGSHMEHGTVAALAEEFARRGIDVVRFNFLYRERGQNGPDRMPRLMECFTAVVATARERVRPQRLFIGGHSMGGRTASMLAADGFEADGAILLAYPLHPAGKPDQLRDAHLPQITMPALCLNGTRDDLCTRELMDGVIERLPSTFIMHWLEAADHSFHVLKRSGRTDADVLAEIGDAATAWIDRLPAVIPD